MFTFVSFEHVSVPIAASNTNRYTAWSVATATEGHITELSGFSLMMFRSKDLCSSIYKRVFHELHVNWQHFYDI